jgi:hypothetical protein
LLINDAFCSIITILMSIINGVRVVIQPASAGLLT